MTFWIIFILVVAVLLMRGIERIMARLGVRPVTADETRTGAVQIASRIERWAERRTDEARTRDGSAPDPADQDDARTS
ncbi:MAG TPA: hypothetical protein VMM78_15630 [Thermomicrobiales bacterium]|nr:hypothetical protein [Thermomicrobiales bacterium]